MAGMIPRERFADVVSWLYPLIGPDDRENMTRIYEMMLPAPVFAGVKDLIRTAIGNDWKELTRRIPGMEAGNR